MAKTKSNDQLFKRLRAQGLRKRTARVIAEAGDRRRKPTKRLRRTLDDLTNLVNEAERRVSGRSARRYAAAAKATSTRRRNAAAPQRGGQEGGSHARQVLTHRAGDPLPEHAIAEIQNPL